MAAKQQIGGENLATQIAGMSKTQLYEIMGQMKNMIEQNPQQARQILIDNPKLTKALFQAQIMLGMVQPPKVVPSFPQAPPQPSQPPPQLGQKNLTPLQPSTAHAASTQQPEYTFPSQIPPWQQQQQQQQQQQKAQQPITGPSIPFSLPQTHHNLPPPLPTHSNVQAAPPFMQPLQRPSFPQPLQPPMPPGLGLQIQSGQQQMMPQPGFHPGGGSSFPAAPPKMPAQPSRQQAYQGASERNPVPVQPPPPTAANQPPPRPPQLTAEMEQALLQQVMSLTPEQISQLPPEHRSHVLQIQQMYRM